MSRTRSRRSTLPAASACRILKWARTTLRKVEAFALPKLLHAAGLAESTTAASNQIKRAGISIGESTEKTVNVLVKELPARWPLRVGKRAKLAVIE